MDAAVAAVDQAPASLVDVEAVPRIPAVHAMAVDAAVAAVDQAPASLVDVEAHVWF